MSTHWMPTYRHCYLDNNYEQNPEWQPRVSNCESQFPNVRLSKIKVCVSFNFVQCFRRTTSQSCWENWQVAAKRSRCRHSCLDTGVVWRARLEHPLNFPDMGQTFKQGYDDPVLQMQASKDADPSPFVLVLVSWISWYCVNVIVFGTCLVFFQLDTYIRLEPTT